MISKDIEPSLRTGEPRLERLDDGFSPPAHEPEPQQAADADAAAQPAELALSTKSPF